MRTARVFTTASLVAALTLSLAATGVARSGPDASGDATTKLGARDAKPHVALPVLQPVRRPSGDDEVLAAGTGAGDVSEVEPNDSSPQAVGDVPFNARGTISSPADIGDCFAFPVTAGDPVRVEVIADRVFGSLLDPFVIVFEDDGATVVIENDNGVPGSVDSFARFTASYTGFYFVCVQDATGAGSEGHVYVLNVTVANGPDAVEQEPNDSLGLADPLTLPAFATGSAGNENDIDFFRFQGTGGTTLIVDIDAAVFSGSLDAVVDLFDGSGRRIFASDDDESSGSLDTRFNIVLPGTGTYFLAVRDITGRGGGLGYRVNVSSPERRGRPARRPREVHAGRSRQEARRLGVRDVGCGRRADECRLVRATAPQPQRSGETPDDNQDHSGDGGVFRRRLHGRVAERTAVESDGAELRLPSPSSFPVPVF
ncbi:MAG: PPC domain-containing protein [Blastocatellia bacterium]|nr:PPC domain-containing protein [Blastocatellia bacterium]